MFRKSIVLVGLLLAGFDGAIGADEEANPSERNDAIIAEIARLGDPKLPDKAPAVNALVKFGAPALPALVTALGDPRNEVRSFAAEAIRMLLAPDPTIAPSYHDKAYWEKRVIALKVGMLQDEALELLFPDVAADARQKQLGFGAFGGGSGNISCRLDDYWAVSLVLTSNREKRYFLAEVPEPVRSVRDVWNYGIPRDFTGVWTSWYVNGRKAHEIQCLNGKKHGASTSYFENGAKIVEQHSVNGECHGADTGWHRNGQKAYEGQYRHGKYWGTWTHWTETGDVQSVRQYVDGEEVRSEKGK